MDHRTPPARPCEPPTPRCDPSGSRCVLAAGHEGRHRDPLQRLHEVEPEIAGVFDQLVDLVLELRAAGRSEEARDVLRVFGDRFTVTEALRTPEGRQEALEWLAEAA